MREKTPVVDESKIEKGPDWYCPYCDSYNPHSATACKNCGHPREAEDKNYFQVRREEEAKKREANQPTVQSYREVEPPVAKPYTSSNHTNPQPSTQHTIPSYHRHERRPRPDCAAIARGGCHSSTTVSRKTTLSPKRIGIICLILALVGLLVWVFVPKNVVFTVTDTAWERTVEVQQYRLVEDSGWSLPSEAVELLRTAREIHHYDQILDHYETVTEQKSRQVQDGYDTYTTYEDMGNGYFKSVEHKAPRYRTEYYTETHQEPVYRNVPVYETKYYYTIWKWVHERNETVSGVTDPYWPQITYDTDEREGARTESYTVTGVTKKNKTASYDCDWNIWSQMKIGDTYKVKTQVGKITEML